MFKHNEIMKMSVTKKGEQYQMDFKCKGGHEAPAIQGIATVLKKFGIICLPEEILKGDVIACGDKKDLESFIEKLNKEATDDGSKNTAKGEE